jgi:2-methylcitrate dehydratase PrpD
MTGSEPPISDSDSGEVADTRQRVAEAVRILGRQSAGLTWSEIPPSVRDRTRLVLFDTLGVTMAGAAIPDVGALAGSSPATGPAPLAGLGRWASAEISCWVNGAAVCSLELDEGSKFARGHPAAHVIPAALAYGAGCEGQAWLTAVLAGYEVAARFGRATTLKQGVHPHGTWGATGAGAAVARLTGLDADGTAAAIDAAAGLSGAPPFEAALTGHPVRNLWVGAANLAGVMAARLAGAGSRMVEGMAAPTFGAMLGSFDPDPLLVPFAERFEIMGGYFKRHAACAYTHAPADAVLELRDRGPLPVEDIEAITVETYRLAANLNRVQWPTRLAAMFSVPYVVAVTLLEGAFGPSASDQEQRADPTVAVLVDRIRVVATDEFDRRLPDRRGARVTIAMKDGMQRSAEVEQPIGDAAHAPFGWDEVRSKVVDLIGPDRAAALEQAVLDLDGGPVDPLLKAVTRS